MILSPELKSEIFVQRTKDLWPHNWQYYLDLVAHEKWSKDQLHEYNFKQRVEIMKYAYENSNFYKRLYDENGLNPQDIRTESDWAEVPIVTKEMIADFTHDVEVKSVIDKFGFAAHTGGSTGKPLRVFRDKRHFWQAPWWRFYGWHLGRPVGDPNCNFPIWGLDEASIDRSHYRSTDEWLRQRDISFWPKTFLNLSPYAEFEKDVDKFIDNLKKSPLATMYVYAGGLDMFVNYCIEKNISFDNVLFIDSCASPLTPIIRNKAGKVFTCKLFDFYGSNEMGPMAIECAHSGEGHHLHVLSDLLNIELVDNDNQLVDFGETGTTIVTSFTNRVFPLIRYNHGDCTHFVKDDCACGLPFPCIAPIRGRIQDSLITKDGAHIDGVGFNEAFDFYPEAAVEFQFRQKQPGEVTLVVVPDKKYSKADEEIAAVINKLNNDFQNRINFTLQLTDSIQQGGGKLRYIIHE